MTAVASQSISGKEGDAIERGGCSQPPAILYGLFFLSGWSALAYEISWNRQIGTVLGHTATSSAVVLAAYFFGLSMGSWLSGRIDASRSPGRLYAYCEVIAALWAIAIPTLVPHLSTLDRFLIQGQTAIDVVIKVGACVLVLAPSTILLGATLPLMSRWLESVGQTNGTSLLWAYAANTLGALLGVLLSTWLLPKVGVSNSSIVAAVMALGCGAIAWWIARSEPHQPTRKWNQKRVFQIEGIDYIWAASAGATAMALEVLYARLFSLVFHNSTYTFSFVLISFLLGIALASLGAARWMTTSNAKAFRTLSALATVVLMSASVSGVIAYTRLQYRPPDTSFALYYASGLGLVVLSTMPVAVALGLQLPATWKASLDGREPTRKYDIVGRLTSVNTFAGAIGALASNFLLFRYAGLWYAFSAIAALVLAPVLTSTRRNVTWLVLVIPLVAMHFAANFGDQTSSNEIRLARWHSSYGLVDLVQDQRSGDKRIQQNLHYRFGSTGFNREREFRQAHLPLILHPHPRSALFLGLGTGMTAGGAVTHSSLKKITIVELIPEVILAAGLLNDENQGIVTDPRTQIIADDARHTLVTIDQRFDVIVSDLFVPWESETGYLYTVETFEAAKCRLASNGIFCQWLPLYQLGRDDFATIADSMRQVFPYITLWWGRLDAERPILALIGSTEPMILNARELRSRMGNIWKGTSTEDYLLSSPARLFELYAGDWPIRSDAKLNTDEHPLIEFGAPVAHLGGATLSRKQLHAFMKEVIDQLPMNNVQMITTADAEEPRLKAWQSAVMFPKAN